MQFVQSVENLTISALAAAAAVNIETIRFYQRKGLIAEPDKPWGSIRRYGSPDLARMRFIKSAQRMGFSLDEIAELLTLEDGTHCTEARQIAGQKLADVRARLADLHRIEYVLQELIDQCQASQGQLRCPLIETLKTDQNN